MTIAALILALLASSGDAQGRGPIILDFHAEWCGPCQQMRPALERLVQKGYPVKSIDIDQDADLAARYHVSSVPTFVVVDPQGRALARTQGLQPAENLASLFLRAREKLAAADEPVVVRAQGADAAALPEDSAAGADPDEALTSDPARDQ